MGLLLWLYPRAFRERYGAEMAADAAAMLAAAPWSRRPALWLGVVRDAVVQSLAERRADAAAARRAARDGSSRSLGELMHTIAQDLRFAARSFARQPGFTVAAVLTIALGIGANVTIFSVVDGALLRPLPYPHPDRLVMLWEIFPPAGLTTVPLSVADYVDYRTEAKTLAAVALMRNQEGMGLTGSGEPILPRTLAVSPSLFPMLGARAEAGRLFRPDEEEPGKGHVVVLSDAFWRRQFGGKPGLVGQTITLNDQAYQVIGILPRDFQFPPPVTFGTQMIVSRPPDLWVPFTIDRAHLDRGSHSHFALAALAPGATVAQATSEVNAIEQRITEKNPADHQGLTGAHVVSVRAQSVARLRPTLLLLMTAVGFVLLVACVNVANLLLARATARQREIGIRLAVGAGRGRLVRQMLTESLLLAAAAGVVGTMLGAWALALLGRFPPIELPAMYAPRLDPSVLLFTLILTAATAVVFGLLPALQSARTDLQTTLKEGRTTTGGGSSRLRGGLIVAEMALALVLLVGAGLTIRSFEALSGVDPGFDPDRTIALNVELPASRYPEPARYAVFYEQVLDRLRALPGVERAAGGQYLPLSADRDGTNYQVAGQPTDGKAPLIVDRLRVTPGYFETLGIHLVRGRTFTDADGPSSQRVAVVNEAFVRRHWAGEDPIGRRFGFGDDPSAQDWITIVGVARDVRREGLEVEDRPMAYLPVAQFPNRGLWFFLRTSGDPTAMVASAKQAIWAVDPNLPAEGVRTLDAQVANAVRRPKFTAIVLAIFGAVGLLLAAVGIYGVMAFDVTQRTREIGIRVALGADPRALVRLLLRRGVGLAGLGALGGLVAALAASRVMSSVLFGVRPDDPATFGLVILLLLAVAALATLVPARRATRVDPVVALRAE
jgi:predicted permease